MIGSLFSGYGGLDLAVTAVTGHETAWVSDIDPDANRVLAERFPGVPNLGDVTDIDWDLVPRVEILVGGSPCQDVSMAGIRRGMTEGTRSNLWVAMRDAVAALRPGLVVWENVGGAYSAKASSDLGSEPGLLDRNGRERPRLRALGRVLGDLAELGYDAVWHGIRATEIGGCHARRRVFVAAYPHGEPGLARWITTPSEAEGRGPLGGSGGRALKALPTPTASLASQRPTEGQLRRNEPGLGALPARDFREYAAAVRSHEDLVGRPVPPLVETSPTGQGVLSPPFVEWVMGLPEGWVCDPEIWDWENKRSAKLKLLGNGVFPHQAISALLTMGRMDDGAP